MPMIQLAVSRAEAKRLIQTQIEEGGRIADMAIRGSDSLQTFLLERGEWGAHTEEVIRYCFTESEYGNNFAAVWQTVTDGRGYQDWDDKVTTLTAALQSQLSILRTAARRVELLREPSLPSLAVGAVRPENPRAGDSETQSPIQNAITI